MTRYVQRAEILREKGTNRSNFIRGQVDKYTWVDVGSSYLPSDLLAALLLAQLDEMVAVARATPEGAARHAELMRSLEAIHLKSLRAHGVALSEARIRELLALDLELNAQGIAIWLDRTRSKT